jgi:chromosome segregation ATPase
MTESGYEHDIGFLMQIIIHDYYHYTMRNRRYGDMRGDLNHAESTLKHLREKVEYYRNQIRQFSHLINEQDNRKGKETKDMMMQIPGVLTQIENQEDCVRVKQRSVSDMKREMEHRVVDLRLRIHEAYEKLETWRAVSEDPNWWPEGLQEKMLEYKENIGRLYVAG